jgi:hypothetical protein
MLNETINELVTLYMAGEIQRPEAAGAFATHIKVVNFYYELDELEPITDNSYLQQGYSAPWIWNVEISRRCCSI